MKEHRAMVGDDLGEQFERLRCRGDLVEHDRCVLARRSEEPEFRRAVADQHVLRLLVVIQHHLVGFAANT